MRASSPSASSSSSSSVITTNGDWRAPAAPWYSVLLGWHTLLLLGLCACNVALNLTYKALSELMPSYVMTLVFLQPLLFIVPAVAVQVVRFALYRIKGPQLDARTLALWAGLAFLIALNVLGQRYASRGSLISGPVGLVLLSVVMPLVMLLSFVLIGRRYGWTHLLGLACIVVAVPLSLIPTFEAHTTVKSALAIVVAVLAMVPLAVYGVWIEQLLHRGRIDLFWTIVAVPIFHTLMCIPMFFLIPVLQDGLPFTMDAIWTTTRDGFVCFFTGSAPPGNTTDFPSGPVDVCTYVWAWFLAYEVALTLQAYLALYVIVNISAAASSMAQAASIPIAGLLFLVPFFDDDTPFSPWVLVSVFLVAGGMVAYRLRKESSTGKAVSCCSPPHGPYSALHDVEVNDSDDVDDDADDTDNRGGNQVSHRSARDSGGVDVERPLESTPLLAEHARNHGGLIAYQSIEDQELLLPPTNASKVLGHADATGTVINALPDSFTDEHSDAVVLPPHRKLRDKRPSAMDVFGVGAGVPMAAAALSPLPAQQIMPITAPVPGARLLLSWGAAEDMNLAGLKRDKKVMTHGAGKKRFEMQDAHVCVVPFGAPGDDAALLAIFDGHAGKECALECVERFPAVLLAALPAEGLRSVDDAAPLLVQAYAVLDQALAHHEDQGATATTVLVWRRADGARVLQCANVGDSTAWVFRDGQALALSVDHKVTLASERERVLAVPGVELAPKATRIPGGLAVSRALGDHFLKSQATGLIGVPSVSAPIVVSDAHQTVVVLASDGLWDILDGQSACDLLQQQQQHGGGNIDSDSGTAWAELLLRAATKSKQCNDNVTVICGLL